MSKSHGNFLLMGPRKKLTGPGPLSIVTRSLLPWLAGLILGLWVKAYQSPVVSKTSNGKKLSESLASLLVVEMKPPGLESSSDWALSKDKAIRDCRSSLDSLFMLAAVDCVWLSWLLEMFGLRNWNRTRLRDTTS